MLINCSICLRDISLFNRQVSVLNCGHFYHANCLNEWLDNELSCPECRAQVTRGAFATNIYPKINEETASQVKNLEEKCEETASQVKTLEEKCDKSASQLKTLEEKCNESASLIKSLKEKCENQTNQIKLLKMVNLSLKQSKLIHFKFKLSQAISKL